MNKVEAQSTVTISLEEHDRLRGIEKAFHALTADSKTMILRNGWYNHVEIINPDVIHQDLNTRVASLEAENKELKAHLLKRKKWYHL